METTAKFTTTGKDVAIVATNLLFTGLHTTFSGLAQLSANTGATIVHAIDKNITKAEVLAHYNTIKDTRLGKVGLSSLMK